MPTRLPSGLERRLQSWGTTLRNDLGRPAIVTVLALVLAFNILARIEVLQEALPFIPAAQLWFHRTLSATSPRLITPKWVKVVEIDQKKHEELGYPTDRTYLAALIDRAVKGDVAVIVLDIKLVAPEGKEAGQDHERLVASDAILLRAVRDATASGVPVVLTTWLEPAEHGSFRRMPNIFQDWQLPLPGPAGTCEAKDVDANEKMTGPGPYRRPTCARIGNINAPIDRRHVPLSTPTTHPVGRSESLALAAVSAYEEVMRREPRTVHKKLIADAIRHDEFVMASFIPEHAFRRVSIDSLHQGVKSALEECRGHIVIIGGKWRENSGRGDWEDRHDTPVGEMQGMYLHANYIEALLDDWYQREVSIWTAVVIDLFAGVCLYMLFHRAKTRLRRAVVLVVPAVLLVVTYLVFTSLNLYLDFVLPLVGCFAHLGVEYFRDYGRLRRAELNRRQAMGAV